MTQEMTLLSALDGVAKLLTNYKKDMLEKSELPDVSMAVCHYIDAIAKSDHVTMGELAKHMGYSKSSVTIMIDKLQRAGLVTKERDLDDQRVYHITLSDKGHEVSDIRNMAYARFIDHVGQRLSEEEQATLTQLLLKIP